MRLVKHIVLVLPMIFTAHCYAQFKLVTLSREDIQNGVAYHYQSRAEYAGADIYLYKNHKFSYSFGTCLSDGFSEGVWKQKENEITFICSYQEGNLPISIRYRKREPGDSFIKKIDFIRDHSGGPLHQAGLLIDNDSTKCFDGDLLCFGNTDKIDSVKVVLESGVSSAWVKVEKDFEVMEITILPKFDFTRYVIFFERYKLERNKQLTEILNQ